MDRLSQIFGVMRDTTPTLSLTLAIGAAGGFLAHAVHLPLAFMLGSLFATMAASLMGAKLGVPGDFRGFFLFVIGLFLGQAFDPGENGAGIPMEWLGTALLAMLYVPVAIAVCWAFYARVAGLERLTALFASIPGGLSAVVMFSGALGADERRVALSQSLRIAIVVLAAPSLFFGLLGYSEPSHEVAPEALLTWEHALMLVAASLAATTALRLFGAPLPFLIAPVLASAVLRMSGLVEGELPGWLVQGSLVVVGSAIGARFAGADPRALLSLAGWTLVGTAILMALSAVFAAVVTLLFNEDFFSALLAFAPGGVAEMCLIAIALDANPSFVAAHHLVRIGFILLAAPLFAAWVRRWAVEQDEAAP